VSRFDLGPRDPQQPGETFTECQERQQDAYEAMVEALDDDDETEYYPSAREIAEEAWS